MQAEACWRLDRGAPQAAVKFCCVVEVGGKDGRGLPDVIVEGLKNGAVALMLGTAPPSVWHKSAFSLLECMECGASS